ncbi:unnamed protein product [Laminaria digitata]
MFSLGIRALILAGLVGSCSSFVNPGARCGSLARATPSSPGSQRASKARPTRARPCPLGMKTDLGPDETVKKYGLEAGLFKALKDGQKEGGEEGEGGEVATTAKDLLKQYGSAYLITSITFALISFGICYVAVSNGVDMAALLGKVGIQTSTSAEKTGTLAVAYAIHKAASPIRFPPTVALTPVVAKFLGKGEGEGEAGTVEGGGEEGAVEAGEE